MYTISKRGLPPSQHYAKRFKQQDESDLYHSVHNNAPTQPESNVYLLSSLTESFIHNFCTQQTYTDAKILYEQNRIDNIVMFEVQTSNRTKTLRLDATCDTFRLSINLEFDLSTIIVQTSLKKANCTCNRSPFGSTSPCLHLLGFLYTIYRRGTSQVDDFNNLEELIQQSSRENLVNCIKQLISNRPETISLIKSNLSRSQIGETSFIPNSADIKVSSASQRAVVSSDQRKAYLPSELSQISHEYLDELNIKIGDAFDYFVQSYEAGCSPISCRCSCHLFCSSSQNVDSMVDSTSNCSCLQKPSDYSFIENALEEQIGLANRFFEMNEPHKALVYCESILRSFSSQLRVIQLPNESAPDQVIPNFPFDNSQPAYNLHADRFFNHGKRLCLMLATVMLRNDIEYSIKSAVASNMEQWINDSANELKGFVHSIIVAAVDTTEGQSDSISHNPLIVQARLKELQRRGDYASLTNYSKLQGVSQNVNLSLSTGVIQ